MDQVAVPSRVQHSNDRRVFVCSAGLLHLTEAVRYPRGCLRAVGNNAEVKSVFSSARAVGLKPIANDSLAEGPMLICEMTENECRRTLPEVTLSRLACAQAGQPYVVPVYLAIHQSYLYGFSSVGKKIECMRANPLVCVEIEDVKSVAEWTTLVVFGTYEELPDTPEYETTRLLAHELLQKRVMWWQPASVAVTNTKQEKTFTPVFYRIRIDRMTGHRAVPEPTPQSSLRAEQRGLLRRILRRIRSRT